MELVVSNIAWTNEEEADVAAQLKDLGVKYIEIAPTKKWENPPDAPAEEIEAYKDFWHSHGIEIVAFQSMLFNKPDYKLFESTENRQQTLDYLKEFTSLAKRMGAGVLVFGSPKNRQKGDMSVEEATDIASDFFQELGKHANQEGVSFCIEPNAKDYACDFITTAGEGIDFVEKVNQPGFGLHLDIACMTLAGDDVTASIKRAAKFLKHFHISSPFLEQVEDRPDVKHCAAAQALKDIGYDNFVSIEMRPGEAGQNVERVRKAVMFAQSVYSS